MLTKRLKELRGKRTQEEIAQGLGISRARYSHYENGRSEPDTEMIQRMATYHNVTTDYLLGNSSDPRITEEQERRIDANVEKTLKILEEADEEDRTELEILMRAFVQMKKEERERKRKERE